MPTPLTFVDLQQLYPQARNMKWPATYIYGGLAQDTAAVRVVGSGQLAAFVRQPFTFHTS